MVDANDLEGTIPTEIGLLQNLTQLKLNDNNLNGDLPIMELSELLTTTSSSSKLESITLQGNPMLNLNNISSLCSESNVSIHTSCGVSSSQYAVEESAPLELSTNCSCCVCS